jgi:hypothetical protein
MRTLMGLLCLSAGIAADATAADSFSLGVQVLGTQCVLVHGANVCVVTERGRPETVVIALSRCSEGGSDWRICEGRWEETRSLWGREVDVRVSVMRTELFAAGDGDVRNQVTAEIRPRGGKWRSLNVTTGSAPSLQDTAQFDGEDFVPGDGWSLTPALRIGPTN